jgi:hypothetical protein
LIILLIGRRRRRKRRRRKRRRKRREGCLRVGGYVSDCSISGREVKKNWSPFSCSCFGHEI